MLYNEEIDEYCRKLREKSDAFLASCGQHPLEVYRIEDFEPIAVPEKHWGKFYNGDSYVVLKQNERDYEIHFWDGEKSTTDEIGCSAAFSVELAAVLTKPSRQHLELQHEETMLFCSYFRGGIQYLEGGVASGFTHVEPETYAKRLLIIKGVRYPRVFEVPASNESINEGDCFILDLGMQLYLWVGLDANMHDKTKALEIATSIKNDDRKSKPVLFYPRDMGDECEANFWAELEGGKPDVIKPMEQEEESKGDADGVVSPFLDYAFYIVDDAKDYQPEEITERPLKAEMLQADKSYILRTCSQMYVWQGKDASINEKRFSMKIATDFKKTNSDYKGQVSRIPAGAEDAHFKSFFEGFYRPVIRDFANEKNMDASTHGN
jgi:hypothetical protein